MSDRERQPNLESKLAEFVRTYIAAVRGDDLSQEPEALRWLCCGLEYFLGEQLEGSDGWNGWVDGIVPATDMLPDAIQVVSSVEVSVRDYQFGPKLPGPPSGSTRSSVACEFRRQATPSYEIHFGDKARGLAKLPIGKHLPWVHWFFPKDWIYSFFKGEHQSTRLQ
jgi:hypothetical protein